MYHMVIEQTYKYRKRMKFVPEKGTFVKMEYNSIAYERGFIYPYGWIKETGTPPETHCDAILMSDLSCELGDEIPVKIIGVFIRKDGDHKFIAVTTDRDIDDFSQLSEKEKTDLGRLYPRIDPGEGWYGKETASQQLLQFASGNTELKSIITKFAESGWDLIAEPSKDWLDGKDNLADLTKAVEQAERECGDCGCEYDVLYRRFLSMK